MRSGGDQTEIEHLLRLVTECEDRLREIQNTATRAIIENRGNEAIMASCSDLHRTISQLFAITNFIENEKTARVVFLSDHRQGKKP